jgi:hypothetical protein
MSELIDSTNYFDTVNNKNIGTKTKLNTKVKISIYIYIYGHVDGEVRLLSNFDEFWILIK